MKTVLFSDSKWFFDTIKRLLIYLASIRKAYANGALSNMLYFTSSHNLAAAEKRDILKAALLLIDVAMSRQHIEVEVMFATHPIRCMTTLPRI